MNKAATIYESVPQPETAQAFVDSLNLPYKAVFVPQSQSRNAGEEPCLNWRITVGTLDKPGCIITDYMQGIGHLPNYSHQFARLVVYNNAVKEACETGISRIIGKAKNAFDSVSHFNRKPLPAPKLVDILCSLVMDASVLDYDCFEDWASEFGYDADSRQAEQIYKDCMAIALKLRHLVDLEKAQEAFQDY